VISRQFFSHPNAHAGMSIKKAPVKGAFLIAPDGNKPSDALAALSLTCHEDIIPTSFVSTSR